jgi:adenine-specific DNA-methyltransferase
MKSRAELSARKLRGGFYTPEPLVQLCLERLLALLPAQGKLSVVEPSAGDGAFVRGLASHSRLSSRVRTLVAIEPHDLEARKCRRSLAGASFNATVRGGSAVEWGGHTDEFFDAAIGNPPFVRYQFVPPSDRAEIPRLGERAGISFAGVSNLWLPVVVAALSRLRRGGAFSFIVPTELLTGLAASRLRRWLSDGFEDLRIDLFPPGSFPAVLQEIAVLSGRAGQGAAPTLTVAEHDSREAERSWTHAIDPSHPNWTRYLLNPGQLQALDEAMAGPAVAPLGSLARFQVSIVTGANDFFSVSNEDRQEFDLGPWTRPLLPRIRHAPGLIYTKRDQAETRRSGARSWLLDFSEQATDPRDQEGPAAYLRQGEKRGLPNRYKCRIRQPWFRVPQIERGALLLSKRSHRFPRVIVNEAASYTTDTIYRGNMRRGAAVTAHSLAASFHSSLTLLTAELEGRSFGGGVLELVPSEIERLAVVTAPQAAAWIERLDKLARLGEEEALVEATDQALVAAGLLDGEIVEQLSEARLELLQRRLSRNARDVGAPAEPGAEAEKLAA